MKKIMIGAISVFPMLLTVVGAQASVNASSGFGIMNNTDQTFTDTSGTGCVHVATPKTLKPNSNFGENSIEFDSYYYGIPCSVTYVSEKPPVDKFKISFAGVIAGTTVIGITPTVIQQPSGQEKGETNLRGYRIQTISA